MQYNQVFAKCTTCGKKFRVQPWRIKKTKEFFCTMACKKNKVSRFWRHVKKGIGDGCWIWMRGIDSSGYGCFGWYDGRIWSTHRLSWTFKFGPIPEGKEVCHSCDNPRCVNPDHLFLGTHKENMQDAKQKGHLVGEVRGGKTILNRKQVFEIRELFSQGLGPKAIHERFPFVSRSAVRGVVYGHNWKHLYHAGLV